jgi:hypothetical protein
MQRITIFAKANVDVHDSLHSFRLNNEIRWNGLNAALRALKLDATARIHHETLTRTDALLSADGRPPENLIARNLQLGAYPLASQFSDALFRTRPDVFVLSIQPDVATGLMRSNQDSYLFYPNGASTWSAGDRAWLSSEFSYAGLLSADESADYILKIIDRIREISDAPILIYNVSSFIPGENVHCYQFIGRTLSSRIKHFNNNLIEISERAGISIVDVDRLVAGHGAETLKIDAMHLNARGYELVSHEVVRILSDIGVV